MAGPFDFLIKVGMDISSVVSGTTQMAKGIASSLGLIGAGDLTGTTAALAASPLMANLSQLQSSFTAKGSSSMASNLSLLPGGQDVRSWAGRLEADAGATQQVEAMAQAFGQSGVQAPLDTWMSVYEARKAGARHGVDERQKATNAATLSDLLETIHQQSGPDGNTEAYQAAKQRFKELLAHQRGIDDAARAANEAELRKGKTWR